MTPPNSRKGLSTALKEILLAAFNHLLTRHARWTEALKTAWKRQED
jgi:hypothetical protein